MVKPEQIKELSKLLLDLGKIIFGATVIGFFVPVFPGQVNTEVFIAGVIFSVLSFGVGIKLTA